MLPLPVLAPAVPPPCARPVGFTGLASSQSRCPHRILFQRVTVLGYAPWDFRGLVGDCPRSDLYPVPGWACAGPMVGTSMFRKVGIRFRKIVRCHQSSSSWSMWCSVFLAGHRMGSQIQSGAIHFSPPSTYPEMGIKAQVKRCESTPESRDVNWAQHRSTSTNPHPISTGNKREHFRRVCVWGGVFLAREMVQPKISIPEVAAPWRPSAAIARRRCRPRAGRLRGSEGDRRDGASE